MKNLKYFIAFFVLVLGIVVSACAKSSATAAPKLEKDVRVISNVPTTEHKIVIRKGEKQIIATLGQGSAAKDLYKRLPLKVKFEDFNSTEKIAYLNSSLNLQGEPNGYTPKPGDLAYYAPWKNLSVFYKDFRYSENLIYLGKIEKGAVNLETFEGEDIVIEKVNN